MTHEERARELLALCAVLSTVQERLDALSIGDASGIPNRLKHTLDDPKEQIRAYARALYLGGEGTQTQAPSVRARTWAEAHGFPAQMTVDGNLYCPNYACEVREIAIEETSHRSGTGTFHCPKCDTLLITPRTIGSGGQAAPSEGE